MQISNAIPVIKQGILTNVALQQVFIDTQFTCRPLAESVYEFRDGLCGKFINFLDAQWLAFAFLAIWGLISVPAVIIFANTFVVKRGLKIEMEYDDDSSKLKIGQMPSASAAVLILLTLATFTAKWCNCYRHDPIPRL